MRRGVPIFDRTGTRRSTGARVVMKCFRCPHCDDIFLALPDVGEDVACACGWRARVLAFDSDSMLVEDREETA